MLHDRTFRAAAAGLLLAAAWLAPLAQAQGSPDDPRQELILPPLDQPVEVDGRSFANWIEYFESDYFREAGKRCATPEISVSPGVVDGTPADCSAGSTNPDPTYEPGVTLQVPVVVHIIENSTGTQGNVPEDLVYSQIDVLNEDFEAIFGSNGAPGYDVRVHFVMADSDPAGNHTSGITRSQNTTWYNDGGGYFNTLAWDPTTYMNIYTNSAGGALGYVPFLPQTGGGSVGTASDRVVILWTAFGYTAPSPSAFDLGRTATHEVGHYFGLNHTFSGGCGTGTVPGCYTSGDLICDTNPETSPNFGCPASRSTCSTFDPIDNYMDYSDDVCMNKFTNEQARRMRCTVDNYRSTLPRVVDTDRIATADFEGGDLSEWTTTLVDGGDLAASMSAAIVGTWGMEALIDDDERIYGQDESLGGIDRARVRFWFDPNDLTTGANKRFRIFQLFSTNPDNYRMVTMVLRQNGGDYFLRAKTHRDAGGGGGWDQLDWVELDNAPNLIEFDWQRASGPGANDGYLRLWVNRRPAGEAAGVDNDERSADMLRLGVVGGISVDDLASGSLYFDAYESRATLYIGK